MKYNKLMLLIISIFTVLSLSSVSAQEARQFTIAIFSVFSVEPFIEEMASLGYIEGENVTYKIATYEDGELFDQELFLASYFRQLEQFAAEGVDLFFVNSDNEAVNIQAITGDTPIVFSLSDDPVTTGAVADLITPGGVVTGIVTNKPHERRLQLLTEIKPDTDKVYYLYSPMTLDAETVLAQVMAVGEELGIEVISAVTPDAATGVAALENTPEGTDWIFLTPYVPFEPSFFEAMMIASMTHQAGISWVTNDPVPGYLIGYGPDVSQTDRQAARIVDRILRGASPAELPVEIAENYLTINLEAAAAIGLEVPVGILRQADLIVRPGYFENLGNAGN